MVTAYNYGDVIVVMSNPDGSSEHLTEIELPIDGTAEETLLSVGWEILGEWQPFPWNEGCQWADLVEA